MRKRIACTALVLALAAAEPARATGVLERRFGSDEANRKNLGLLMDLLGPDAHFDVRVGTWFANLGQGPMAALSADQLGRNIEGFETAAGAGERIGTGSGTLREIGVELGVAGNEAFFDYLSDQLLAAAKDEIRNRVSNERLREQLLLIAGELRPDLKSILGPDAQVWLASTYGRFDGVIDDSSFFRSRNGEPFFGSGATPWSTRFFSLEGGALYGDPDDEGTVMRGGLYVRYMTFQMPTVIGIYADLTDGSLALQDGQFEAAGVGLRGELAGCGETFCGHLETSFIPLTGYGRVDLGDFGKVGGFPVMLSADVGGSLPLRLGNLGVLRPYASFRVDWFGVAHGDAGAFGGKVEAEPEVPDYLLWGPRVGVGLEL